MSLFSSIQLANNALRVAQIGLQVTGQNIANANTPGYIREVVELSPLPTQRDGSVLLGMGVRVDGVVQKVDRFLDERLRGAVSERAGSEVTENTYQQIESLLAELGEQDLSSSLNGFFAAISEILNQPESLSVRNLAVLKGKALAGDINQLASRLGQIRSALNERVEQTAVDINRLTEEIRQLNVRIAETEGGAAAGSEAVGLRDQRGVALSKLAEIIDIKVQEQESGTVWVFSGGTYLVFDSQAREVEVTKSADRGSIIASIELADTRSPLELSNGELAGLTESRDDVIGTLLDDLDQLAFTLATEFNKLFSSGQGLTGYSQLTSQATFGDLNLPLDESGLNLTPVNGSFQVLVFNRRTGLTETSDIRVDLNGLDADTSLAGLAAALDAVDGISVAVSAEGLLTLRSDSADQEFAFANDTSGTLAALGINTFFTGNTASGLGINATIQADPSKFAASRNGIGEDTLSAIDLAGFLDRPLDSRGGNTLAAVYDRLVAGATQSSTVAHSVAEGSRAFESSLRGQQLAVSGVSIDEEVVRMIEYQRAFQASARYIATLSELFEVLVNL